MFDSIDEIKAANARRGHKFFTPGAMRFFDSRILHGVIHGRYFITSEQFHGSNNYSLPRRYTVRRANDDGSIDTMRLGDPNATPMHSFATAREARQAAERLADSPSPCANCRQETYNRNFTCDECSR